MDGNIVLCGFMGCGKTSVGKRAAKLMNRKFCDLDQYIERKEV
ncbi:MAG: shikimate kinase [Eubacteriales bacterium]